MNTHDTAIDKRRSRGAVIIKPDAIEHNQTELIRSILKKKAARFGGKIATEVYMSGLDEQEIAHIYPDLHPHVMQEVDLYLNSGPCIGLVIDAPLSIDALTRQITTIKGPRVGDRTHNRLYEGRILDGTLRDLLPLPGDEEIYRSLIPAILQRQANPILRRADPRYAFTEAQYTYYSRNLVHSPDNRLELDGLLGVIDSRRNIVASE